MRILEVGSSLYDWGGIERFVTYLTTGLSNRGHQVAVTCPPDSPLHRKCSSYAIPISARRRLDPVAIASYLRLYRSQKFEVVHVHFTPDISVAALAARLCSGPKVILTRHTAEPWKAPKTRAYLRLIDHIAPVSNAVEQVLANCAVPRSRMTVAKGGCPPLEPTRPTEATTAEFTVGYFGRLEPEKGVDVAIQASALAQIPLAIYGEGTQRPALGGLAKEKAAPCRFYGQIEDVADAMNAVDIIVIPSRWAEAFPIAALEAMSLGKPIVAAAVGGLPELVEPNITGLLVPSEDPSALASALESLRVNQGWSPEILRRYRENYTVEKMAERMEAVFQAVVSK